MNSLFTYPPRAPCSSLSERAKPARDPERNNQKQIPAMLRRIDLPRDPALQTLPPSLGGLLNDMIEMK